MLSLFLNRFGSKIGLAPKFEIMSLSQEYRLEKQILKNFEAGSFRNYFSDLQEISSGSDILKSFGDIFGCSVKIQI